MVQLYLTLIDDEGERARFEEAYFEYKGLLHYIAKGILHDEHRAEDAVQEAFIRIAKNFHKVGEIKGKSTKNFFVLITRRISLNMLEREEKFSTATEGELKVFLNTSVSSEPPDYSFAETELVQAILRLPESYRNVLYLQAIYGFNGSETANLLGISTEVVWKRTSRARTALKKELRKRRGMEADE